MIVTVTRFYEDAQDKTISTSAGTHHWIYMAPPAGGDMVQYVWPPKGSGQREVLRYESRSIPQVDPSGYYFWQETGEYRTIRRERVSFTYDEALAALQQAGVAVRDLNAQEGETNNER